MSRLAAATVAAILMDCLPASAQEPISLRDMGSGLTRKP
jgi:hypothetical protein